MIDDLENLFAHPVYGTQTGQDAEFIIKIGAAFGVSLLPATHLPGKNSLPTDISGLGAGPARQVIRSFYLDLPAALHVGHTASSPSR